jgi:hypothetical protein
MGTQEQAARMVWQYGEPIHAVLFFAPETRTETDELGLKGGWMIYFGCRAAPLGAVSAAVVTSIFYGFHAQRVERAIPDVWDCAEPQRLLDARLSAMDAALGRLLGKAVDGPDVRRAASLARSQFTRLTSRADLWEQRTPLSPIRTHPICNSGSPSVRYVSIAATAMSRALSPTRSIRVSRWLCKRRPAAPNVKAFV